MTREERRSEANGIWLCQDCGKVVDSNDSKFTVTELHDWKRRSDEDLWRSVVHNIPYEAGMTPTANELRLRLRAAAVADLETFKQNPKWPRSEVPLTLMLERLDEPLTTRSLAEALTTFDDLVLIAPPGMGKTSTLFQVADQVVRTGTGVPLFVSLGDWATGADDLLASVLNRAAFSAVSLSDLRSVIEGTGVVLLLDGWNELDAKARARAASQVEQLGRELPQLALIVSTRKEARNVPFSGTVVELLPLGDDQQLAIARAIRGEDGEKLVDQAWRTPGVRDLITIPLYLTALLDLPPGEPFPRTKEEVLSRFIVAHEADPKHSVALAPVVGGFQQTYLENLSNALTASASTAVTLAEARTIVNGSTQALIAESQLSSVIAQPNEILAGLVSDHILVVQAGTGAYSFQHQQFQEWYASHEAERRMRAAVGDPIARHRLKTDILDQRPWTEAILFAVERASRGDAARKTAVADAILAAFEVDPLLAAEMIYRATDAVWTTVAKPIRSFVDHWHTPDRLGRVVGFMIATGRPEFGDLLWPVLTHEDDQVHLAALRMIEPFRPSVFGADAADRIAALPKAVRRHVLAEIAANGGMDGLDLATAIAVRDQDAEVQATVIEALAFRRADRHVTEILRTAGDPTYDLIARKGHVGLLEDETVQARQREAEARQVRDQPTPRDTLHALLRTGAKIPAEEVAAMVAAMDNGTDEGSQSNLLHELKERYPVALAVGLLQRLRTGKALFFGADDVIASAGFSLEGDDLLEKALSPAARHDDVAEAAASVLGPRATGALVDAYLAAADRVRPDGRYDEAASARFLALRDRLAHTPGTSLVTALEERAATVPDDKIVDLAALASRNDYGQAERARPFGPDDRQALGRLAQNWGERLLRSTTATRYAKASIATLISQVPAADLLPILRALLDDNIARYAACRLRVDQGGRLDKDALRVVQSPHFHEYQAALGAIDEQAARDVAADYLTDLHFGEYAARVLLQHWTRDNIPKTSRMFGGEDFTRVGERRQARDRHRNLSAESADRIFAAIDTLLRFHGDDPKAQGLAVSLGTLGTLLPHGNRDAVIERLLDLAGRRTKARLILSLVVSGERVAISRVEAGIGELLEAARTETWLLDPGNPYELKEWLQLLPFAHPQSEVPRIMATVPASHRSTHILDSLIGALGSSPEPGAEETAFALAEADPCLFDNHTWRATVLGFGTASAAVRLIDLIVSEQFDARSVNQWRLQSDLAGMIADHPMARLHVRTLLAGGIKPGPLLLLARALGEAPETEDILFLVASESQVGEALIDWRSIERATTARIPSEDWQGAFHVVPAPAVDLRKALLALTSDGGPDDRAARCLNDIDKLRDRYGAPETEPRHPDLASGKPWPILTKEPDADRVAYA
ncbi:hypothetical protein [Brevundimonas sp. SL161]|uniref:NACHT domain-containing protein n=1 Tax=Brevundimonas sp. SL161 TaxID=2804613 RepID=UPI003CF00ECC